MREFWRQDFEVESEIEFVEFLRSIGGWDEFMRPVSCAAKPWALAAILGIRVQILDPASQLGNLLHVLR